MLGPFYKPNAPAQAELCASGSGGKERLLVVGQVRGMPDCAPLGGALVEVWQADERGDYTQVGAARPDDPACLLRASIVADGEGRYRFATVAPGEYPGRPRHIHYRVSRKGYATLVTQLYFARERGVADPLVVTPARNEQGVAQATFDITLARA
jgi:protocatechuate 3,4-dioxygenase beta subunit